jgi:hypothetical protein
VALTGRVFGHYPGRELALFLLSCTLAVTVWWRYVLLVRGQRSASAPSGDHRDDRGVDDHHATAANPNQPEV